MKRNTFSERRRFSRRMSIGSVTRRLGLGLVLTLCCAGIVLGVLAHNAKMPVPETPTNTTRATVTAQAGPSEREAPQVVRFALYDVGIYPYEEHVSKGLIAVSFEDLSGGAGDVVVARETGAAPETVGLVQHADHNPRGRSDLKLEPGRYQVYVADHPENRATLVVE